MKTNVEVPNMPLIKVKKNFQITLPTALRKTLKIAEGDYLEVEKQDSELVLKPVKVVHPDQAYFYCEEWQECEKKADEDIRKGDIIGPFGKIKDGLKALKTAKI
jgi:AbrB family looped-hinge helix DNA binding protein